MSHSELLIAAMIVLGAGFALIGSIGLARLPTLMERLHAPTKATTLGVGALLAAAMLHAGLIGGRLSTHEVLVTLFLFLTAPVAANMIAKVHLHRLRLGEEAPGPAGAPPLPPPSPAPAPTPGGDWATHREAEPQSPARIADL